MMLGCPGAQVICSTPRSRSIQRVGRILRPWNVGQAVDESTLAAFHISRPGTKM